MRIDETHRGWAIGTIAAFAIATVVYVLYAAETPGGARGGTAVGLTFGMLGAACMVVAGLLGARKKVPVWRVGRASTWMRAHLWLGLLSLPLILFHGGFHFGGTLTSVLMVLLIAVVVSGVFGAALQHYLPGTMTREVPMETIYEEIVHVRGQLREEAAQIVAAACAAPEKEKVKAAEGAEEAGAAEAAAKQAEFAPLARFYENQMKPFLEQPSGGHALGDAGRASGIFEELHRLLPPAAGDALADLENICEEERQLARQLMLHHWMHWWLLAHIPMSLALLVLGAVHAVMALRFT